MSVPHTVKQGECLSSIAVKYGHLPDKIWDDSKHAKLKEKRKDPNVLYPGDVIFVPDKVEKEESGGTKQRHRFRKKGVPAKLRLQLMDDDEPRANENYILEIDGNQNLGTTDGDGKLEHKIPPNAKDARLILCEGEEEYVLKLGNMDPSAEIFGAQARLNNLGFGCGKESGVINKETKTALQRFQEHHQLEVSGELDEATSNKLIKVHGC